MPDPTGDDDTATSRPGRSLAAGPGRLLVVAYAVFAISALARAGYQLLTRFSTAPAAYLLSLIAAAVYLLAVVALTRRSARWWPTALGAVLFETVGVLVVGTWTTVDPRAFGDETVWSHFGAGYGYLPLLLPFVGLAWLVRRRPRDV